MVKKTEKTTPELLMSKSDMIREAFHNLGSEATNPEIASYVLEHFHTEVAPANISNIRAKEINASKKQKRPSQISGDMLLRMRNLAIRFGGVSNLRELFAEVDEVGDYDEAKEAVSVLAELGI